MDSRPETIQNSFGRGLDVLIAIARHGQTSVAELAAELGIPTSTIYRYVRSLRAYALIEEADGAYIPGWRLMDLAGHHLTHTRLVELGADYLDRLSEQTAETSVLAVRAGTQAICLRQVMSSQPDRHVFRVNELLPLHAGAGQRVLLAYAPRPVIEAVLAQRALGGAPAPARENLQRLVEETRKAGFTVSRGELQEGAFAVAVPVFASGEVACSLTVAGPASRCSSDRWRQRVLSLLKEAADELGRSVTT